MRFFIHLAILFYFTLISLFCVVAFLFANQQILFEDVVFYLNTAYVDPQIGLGISLSSFLILLLSLPYARILSGSRQKERTIAFDNPSGRVSISLSAMEDTIKRSVLKILEVKEIKPLIRATKKGIEITCRLILRSESNIPELTSRLQEIIKEGVQDVLGIEENVIVQIHITRIVSELGKAKKKPEGEDLQGREALAVPFQGYHK